MEPCFVQQYDGMAVANFAAVQDGVTLYPDQVKVQVSMDSGRVVGAECSQYLANHMRRTDVTPTVTAARAREMVSPKLTIKSERLCVIPLDAGEALCWGFSCTDGAADYASAFAALDEEEEVGIVVCDSASAEVHQSLKESVENASKTRRERIAVVGGAKESVTQMTEHAKKLNSERVVLVGPDIMLDGGAEASAVFAAAAVAGAIAQSSDASVPINGAVLSGIAGVSKRLGDNEIDQLVRGGVTPIECVGGVCSPVRGITTKTTSGGAANTTWRELTTILIADEVIPTIRSALRARFARSKNTAQSRGAIRSQVVLEREEMKNREIVDSYGEVLVSALASDPTVCQVEFSFTVAHGLNRIYLTAHITV